MASFNECPFCQSIAVRRSPITNKLFDCDTCLSSWIEGDKLDEIRSKTISRAQLDSQHGSVPDSYRPKKKGYEWLS